jgi:glutaminase
MKKNIFKSALRISLLLTVLVFIAGPVLKAQTKEQIEKALNDAYEKFKNLKEGKNADYIKELAM